MANRVWQEQEVRSRPAHANADIEGLTVKASAVEERAIRCIMEEARL
jgi:hypothetical protein